MHTYDGKKDSKTSPTLDADEKMKKKRQDPLYVQKR